ncbi:MAG: NAD(P)-binding domain-containing protein [Ktedonobacteraceae bacterium]|nr:NAD(P)-binding domain-containing protein [Ktedonobacteraceae bacterium]
MLSSAYKSLFIDTSKRLMQYSDYPMPDHYPVLPHHTQIAEYFDNYAEHFGIKPYIRFTTLVTQARPLAGGGWEVTLDDGSTHCYRALLVANGHHWDPRWPEPEFAGHFAGTIMHSHYYKTPDAYVGKHVLVVGFGNSAVDIAAEISRISAMTYLSARRGFYVIPKYAFGKPADQIHVPKYIPFAVRRRLFGLMLRLQVGNITDYGVPKPDHDLLQAHPTISSDILTRKEMKRGARRAASPLIHASSAFLPTAPTPGPRGVG